MSKDCNNCKFTFRKLSIARFPYFKDTASIKTNWQWLYFLIIVFFHLLLTIGLGVAIHIASSGLTELLTMSSCCQPHGQRVEVTK